MCKYRSWGFQEDEVSTWCLSAQVLRLTAAREQPGSQAMFHRAEHPKVQTQKAEHKMSSQATACQILLLHWRQRHLCPPPEKIKHTQVSRLKALMKTAHIGFQVGAYGSIGYEKCWLTEESAALCSDTIERAQPL